jgi:hypothetical protein
MSLSRRFRPALGLALAGVIVGIAAPAAFAGKKPKPAAKAKGKDAKGKDAKGKDAAATPAPDAAPTPTPADAGDDSPFPDGGKAPTAPAPAAASTPTPTPTPAPAPAPAQSGFVPGDAAAATALHDSVGGDTAATAKRSKDDAHPDDLGLRLTLSTFAYREHGDDAAPFITSTRAAPVPNASPVRRYFGDLRAELTGDGLTIDGRVRQTTSQRYQSGAVGGGEYELRAVSYKLGGSNTSLVLGRQFIDAVASTKIDGVAVAHRFGEVFSATVFGGTYPALGSRSLDTDYPTIKNADGTTGGSLIPVTGGLGLSWRTPDVHGDLGLAMIQSLQNVNRSTDSDKSRIFASSSGFYRPTRALDIYHFGVLDLAGGVRLANGSVGVDLHPIPSVQLTASYHHINNDLLQVAARNLLTDPDLLLAQQGLAVVQNNISVLHLASDTARGGISLAIAHARFELSASAGLHKRAAVDVPLSDGTSLTFAEVQSSDVTFNLLDRDSVAGMRIALSGTITSPGAGVPNRSSGEIVRVSAGRSFRNNNGEWIVDGMWESYKDAGAGTSSCATNADLLACYGTAKTTAVQLGGFVSWRVGREWLLFADTHAGLQDATSTAVNGAVTWPKIWTVTGFARIQWRFQ